tara:strand:- start:34032 stop:35903 length:1872 start_codon:yes stop_codon:yes gene_type:complete
MRVIISLLILFGTFDLQANFQQDKPNILWVSCEDITTMLGCYGDVNASTPNLDKFAKKSILFSNAFSTAPVCSPARSSIITGYYATTIGTQHLRSEVDIPNVIKPFPKYLREIGYYAVNNYKEDYNFTEDELWSDSSKNAHWKNREKDQPFFSVFNLGITHQSGIFGNDSIYNGRIDKYLGDIEKIDPETLVLPSYYPDSPVIRKLWARYYTNVAIMDYQFGQILKELKGDGLEDNTIVIFFSDHGTGMPRSKRALYDSGLKIPMLVHIPQKLAVKFNRSPGTIDDQMVSFIDFAPTMLEIAGIDKPETWPGHAFISNKEVAKTPYVFATSDRVDEGYEMTRSIRTKEYRYVRNFFPFSPLLQPNFYTDQSAIMVELEKFRNSPGLTQEQLTLFAKNRMPEELYDVQKDPDETYNLAYDPTFQKTIKIMRGRLKDEMMKSFDTGLMPEPEMIRLSANSTPYAIAHDPSVLPIERILETCDWMLESKIDDGLILKGLQDPNGFVRYWTLITIQAKGGTNPVIILEMENMLYDTFPTVQIEAAKSLIQVGKQYSISTILKHLNSNDDALSLYAARTFQQMAPFITTIPKLVYEKYLQLKQDADNGTLKNNFYKTYTYWALHETLE